MAGTLLLFDIDGTLVWRASSEHAAALREALESVHGLSAEATRTVDAAGRTDGEIARLLLLGAGIPAQTIDERAGDVRAATAAAYARRCPEDLSDRVLEGIPELLHRLAGRADVRLSLVTGNFEAVARLKLRAAGGIGRYFAAGQGGFGSDSEDRTVLPGIARRRAGAEWGSASGSGSGAGAGPGGGAPWPVADTIVIGDTPRDIACARADGVRCVAVATGPYEADQLSDADAVAGPGELGDVLAGLLGA